VSARRARLGQLIDLITKAIRGIDGQIAHGDTFHNDRHPDLKADFILANPPFNVSDWRGELLRDDPRWQYGAPPPGNANFAWVQHIVHHLAPAGVAGFVLANGSMSSNQSGEGEIRKKLVEADRVDCMVALPGQLFYSTQIPACLWFLARDRKNGKFRSSKSITCAASLARHPPPQAHLRRATRPRRRAVRRARGVVHPGATQAPADARRRSPSRRRVTRHASPESSYAA
jgi:hypothetical protein